MQVDLNCKIALVTGAGRGIGQAIGDALRANGATVYYTDVNEENARAAAESTNAQGTSARSMALDVTDEAQIDGALAQILGECGRLDILVNNAGVNTLHNRVTLDKFALEEWDRILRVDLTGMFLVSRAASRPMLEQGAGRIINIASVVGLVPLRLQSAYVAAKAGVVNLTKSMALEFAPKGVLVNAVAPGSILTEPCRQVFYGDGEELTETAQRLLSHVPLGRPGTPEDIAHAALFLAAPESSYINGHVLTVDGGWTAGYMRDF